MSRITLLWLISAYLPALGDPVTGLAGGNFPMDLMAESTGAVQKTNQPKMKTDEDRKTLSQQVADGKYGLIQKELFTNPSPRPGVLSYESNGEVPKDNVNNFGGLNKSDIWLAENHLLVLKGGVFPLLETLPEYAKPAWPPIDDYDAPRRQVKLPKHPKVPPPFPVQLTDGGPIQILGTNFTRTLNDSFFSPPYPIPPLEGYDPGSNPFFPPEYPYPPNVTSGKTPLPAPPYPPAVQNDGKPDQFPFPVNGGIPPFFDSLPPGSAILPPPNITDQYDEDDLSIYYPPPYSFYYPKDNTTQVPPGPLVPGIVLPPPPNFFGVLTKSSPSTTESPRPTQVPTVLTNEIRKTEINATFKSKPQFKEQPPRNKSINITVLRPIKPTRKPPPVYIYDNNVVNKPFEEYGPPPPRRQHGKITITTTKVPLRSYYRTSSEIDTNLVTRSPQREQYTTRSRSKPPTRIYYYDDTPITNSISTPYPTAQQNRYINFTKNYYKDVQQAPLQPQYYYLPSKSYITQRPKTKIVQQTYPTNNFKSHIVQLQEQIQSYQRPPQQYQPSVFQDQSLPPSKPVYQYSFEVANYKEQHDKLNPDQNTNYRNSPKFNVQIEPALELTTTEAPIYQNTPSPIYYQENYRANPQRPSPQKFYPDYDYQVPQKYSSAVTPHQLDENAFTVTPNPIYQSYYTRQEEQLFDDITKKYFTTFGKKLATSTTPIPPVRTPSRQLVYSQPEQNLRIRTNRPSYVSSVPLKDNIINYVNQRPPQNLQPQYIQPQVAQYRQPFQPGTFVQGNENYRKKTPNVQTIQAISLPSRSTIGEGKPGSFISYELPGDDGAHFYFLTPQLTQKDDRGGITYYYTQPSGGSRIRRST